MSMVDMHDTYMVVMKVLGSAIHLWPYNEPTTMSKNHSFQIYCHDRERREDTDNIKVFVLPGADVTMNKSVLKFQQEGGESLNQDDMAIFMTPPADLSKGASFTLDLGIATHKTSLEDLDTEGTKRIGSVFVHLEPKFATQGVQRMQIIGALNLKPIGQMQVEYLVIRNPQAYGADVPRPKWLNRVNQLDAGHRGSGSGCRADLNGSITENTVASFNYAARHGADMCELDVMCTLDGVPVVYHNFTLDTSKPGSTQIDELTLEELRNLQNISIHDKNCQHNLDTSDTHKSCRPFPTLEEVLQDVDQSCALNIELKWAQLLTNGRSEAIKNREINDFVDRILDCIHKHNNGRSILLSTFNPDVAVMLRLKQTEFPVLFLTTGDSQRFHDPATKSVRNAVHYAQAFDLAGVNPNVAYLTESLVRYAQDRGLLVYAWGKIESAQAIRELKRTGLNGVIYDKIDLIKPHD